MSKYVVFSGLYLDNFHAVYVKCPPISDKIFHLSYIISQNIISSKTISSKWFHQIKLHDPLINISYSSRHLPAQS